MVELVKIHRDTKGAARYVEDVVARIAAMSERHGGDAAWLAQQVWTLFAQRSPLLFLWARLDRDKGEIVGHIVATIQQWDGETVAWIHQAENDGPAMDNSWWDLVIGELKRWVDEVNAALGQNVPHVRRLLFSTPHNPRLFERRGGFTVYRTLMERRI